MLFFTPTFVHAQLLMSLYNMKVQQREFNKLRCNMVYVQGGSFMMGTNPEKNDGDKGKDDAKPRHKVTVSSFYICKYEVTQALWKAVMRNNPSKFKGDDLPVEQVSWDDCQQFIRKLNALTGCEYRLPTEAEWEFAARGGNSGQGYKYSGSNNIGDVAWYGQEYVGFLSYIDGNSGDKTHPVGSKSPNELGLFDMTGNVCEWCSDWYGAYNSNLQSNPTGPKKGTHRILRCGSWYDDVAFCTVSYRREYTPDTDSFVLGLRLVSSSDPKSSTPASNMPKAPEAPRFGLG